MGLADKLPSMTDLELQNLHDNAARIASAGTQKQSEQAAQLLPFIKTEQEARAAKKPVPVRKPSVRKKAAVASTPA